MKVKKILVEDFVNYKKPSMFIATCSCTWKCCIEKGLDKSICQNSEIAQMPTIEIENEKIYKEFVNNPITKSVSFGGLEPLLQIDEILELIKLFRDSGENCPFIIYTGYNKDEIEKELNLLKKYKNIIVKFGRFIPNSQQRYDDVLGVTLASNNQYAEVIS